MAVSKKKLSRNSQNNLTPIKFTYGTTRKSIVQKQTISEYLYSIDVTITIKKLFQELFPKVRKSRANVAVHSKNVFVESLQYTSLKFHLGPGGEGKRTKETFGEQVPLLVATPLA